MFWICLPIVSQRGHVQQAPEIGVPVNKKMDRRIPLATPPVQTASPPGGRCRVRSFERQFSTSLLQILNSPVHIVTPSGSLGCDTKFGKKRKRFWGRSFPETLRAPLGARKRRVEYTESVGESTVNRAEQIR